MVSKTRPRQHPGKGKKRARFIPKGRQTDPVALKEVRALLGKRPRRRDLLIEHLHLLQDRYHALFDAHLCALADEMRLSLAEVYEVASFYAHFDVVKEGMVPPPPITIRVCSGVVCEMMGAADLRQKLESQKGDNVRVCSGPCMGRCAKAPIASIGTPSGETFLPHATAKRIAKTQTSDPLLPEKPTALSFDSYVGTGGYALLRTIRKDEGLLDAYIATLDAAGLRGLGGAGFPCMRKWEFVRAAPGPRVLVVNADESEPGTFKDRFCLTGDPHRVLEGMLIAAHAVGADAAYFYLRDEYGDIRENLRNEIPKIEAAGLGLPSGIHLRRGGGAYVCGEESAMLESIEGKRGYPRHRPPFPAESGLFGRPTLIQNVETLYWIREILEKGADWYQGEGRNGGKGVRLFSVSGRVKRPGVKRAPTGITARQLIEEHAGGMVDGHCLKAFLPGGAAGGILPAELADTPLDFGVLDKFGAAIGSAAVIVLSDQDDLREIAQNLMAFFESESCGQCVPCRVGTEKAVKLLAQPRINRGLLEGLAQTMVDASICGLGQTAPNPLRSLFRYFPDALSPGDG